MVSATAEASAAVISRRSASLSNVALSSKRVHLERPLHRLTGPVDHQSTVPFAGHRDDPPVDGRREGLVHGEFGLACRLPSIQCGEIQKGQLDVSLDLERTIAAQEDYGRVRIDARDRCTHCGRTAKKRISTSFCIVGSDNSRTIMTHNDGRGGAVDLRQIQVGRARIDISQGQLARAMHVPGSPPDRGQSHET